MGALDGWIDELGLIGGNGSAVTRFAWAPELLRACLWLVEQLRELGLRADIDAADNVIGRWEVEGSKRPRRGLRSWSAPISIPCPTVASLTGPWASWPLSRPSGGSRLKA